MKKKNSKSFNKFISAGVLIVSVGGVAFASGINSERAGLDAAKKVDEMVTSDVIGGDVLGSEVLISEALGDVGIASGESVAIESVAIESVAETVPEIIPEKIDYSVLRNYNPGGALVALSKSGNSYGKWQQDQNGDVFFAFTGGSQRKGHVATGGWYAIEDAEIDESAVASPSDKVLARLALEKSISSMTDAEILKVVGGRTFSWYHFDESGKLQTGWYRDGKDTYFLSEDEDTKGRMCIGNKIINGVNYVFSSNPKTLGILE